MSSRSEELPGVFAIQEVKSVANCNDRFGVNSERDPANSRRQYIFVGYSVTHLVEALRYKPEGRGYDSPCGRWDVLLT
jgi:hypothetical protein